jgi:hypothetical protein
MALTGINFLRIFATVLAAPRTHYRYAEHSAVGANQTRNPVDVLPRPVRTDCPANSRFYLSVEIVSRILINVNYCTSSSWRLQDPWGSSTVVSLVNMNGIRPVPGTTVDRAHGHRLLSYAAGKVVS